MINIMVCIKQYVCAVLVNVIMTTLTCIVMKPNMFERSLMHFPIGSIGSYMVYEYPVQGYIYMVMVCLYQCMEMYAHLIMYEIDYSWVDLEGYIIGFTYTTVTLNYLKNLKAAVE